MLLEMGKVCELMKSVWEEVGEEVLYPQVWEEMVNELLSVILMTHG